MTRNPYSGPTWQKVRRQVLAEEPVCHWCKKAPATEADHLIEVARGGTNDRDNLVGSCKTCNSRRGAEFQAKQATRRRNAPSIFGSDQSVTPSPLISYPRETEPDDPESGQMVADGYIPGQIPPRLATPRWDSESYGPLVAAWAATHLELDLYPWQLEVLDGMLAHHSDGTFCHRWSLHSTARQQGKTRLLAALIGWWLTEGRLVRGGPQSVLSAAHRHETAKDIGWLLFPILETRFDFKTYVGSTMFRAIHDDGTVWRVSAARPASGHGTSNDLIVVDELFGVDPVVINSGFLPTQRARPNPLAVFCSTAGTDKSVALEDWRRQGMQIIEKGEPDRLHFVEWSPPPNVNPADRRYWHLANPALDLGFLTMSVLEDDFNGLKREDFMRSSLNVRVSAENSWLPVGTWEQHHTDDPMPDGGVIAIDSGLDDHGYFGVRAARNTDGLVHVRQEIVATSIAELWDELRTVMDRTGCKAAIGITLIPQCPLDLQRRSQPWGVRELNASTGPVQAAILEGRIRHSGQITLTEQINRAVGARSDNRFVLSTVKSPGPIELARCLVSAVGFELAAKPVGRPAFAKTR